jgi:glycosyltransferase involved in cell wall biosynthesis
VRVLFVTDWPALEAGSERYVELAFDGLRRQGHEVRLMTSSAGSAANGRADYVAYGTDARAIQAGLQVVNPSAVLTLRRALRDFRPDAVHLTVFLPHLSPAILPLLRDVATLLMVLDYKPVCMNSTRIRPDGSHCDARAGAVCWEGGCVSRLHYARDAVRYRMMRAGLRDVDAVCTISRSMQRVLAQAEVDAEAIALPVAGPGSAFERRRADDPTFVFGGRFAPVKGVDVLLRAFARVRAARPDARLRLYGDGPDRAPLMQLCDALGLADSVTWTGGMVRDWADRIGDAWAVVAPSTFPEPFGLVAVESIVRGIPVIATDGGGFQDTVEPGVSGALVPHGDDAALAEAMLAVAERPADVPAEIVAAMRERHDPDAHAALLSGLLAASPAPGPASVPVPA